MQRHPFSQRVCGLKQNRCAVLNLSPDIVEECTLCDHVEEQSVLISVRIVHVCDDFIVAHAFQRVKAETDFLTIFTRWKARATLVAAAAVGHVMARTPNSDLRTPILGLG